MSNARPEEVIEKLIEAAGEEAREEITTVVNQLREEGRKNGRRDGAQKLLIKLLRVRFGTLSDAAVTCIRAARLKKIRGWVARITQSRSPDELLTSKGWAQVSLAQAQGGW